MCPVISLRGCITPAACAAFVHVAVPIAVGGGIYFVFRDPTLLMFRWVSWIGGLDVVNYARSACAGWSLPTAVRFSLPDALWVYATTSWLHLIWRGHGSTLQNPWVYSGFALSVGGELGQACRFVPGTFDPIDLIGSALAFLASLLVFRRNT